MWLFREDFRVEYAEDVRKVDQGPNDTLSLLCPTRRILDRGNTLNQPTVTIVRISIARIFISSESDTY
jgi:alpha-D-xyloside xylohydrolase